MMGQEGRRPDADAQLAAPSPETRPGRLHQPGTWLIVFAAALVLVLIALPSWVRLLLWRGLQANALLAVMVLAFAIVALSLTWAAGYRIDSMIFLYVNGRGQRPAWLDAAMTVVTQLGNSLAAFILALLFWLSGQRLLAYALLLGTLSLWLVVELIKVLAHRRRPYVRLPEARIVGRRAGGRSFPSGHTSQSFFVATLLTEALQLNLWVAAALYVIALLVGITRIYVGAHYPRDVLAGAILGCAWGILTGLVFGRVL